MGGRSVVAPCAPRAMALRLRPGTGNLGFMPGIPARGASRMTRANCLIAAALFVPGANLAAAPVHYTIDPQHTSPGLEFPHMGISVWRGRFNETTGRFTLDREARRGTVEVRVATDSIDFGLESMREFAIKPDWLE